MTSSALSSDESACLNSFPKNGRSPRRGNPSLVILRTLLISPASTTVCPPRTLTVVASSCRSMTGFKIVWLAAMPAEGICMGTSL